MKTLRTKFKIPLQSEVSVYMRQKRGWPEKFCDYYAERFWNHYTASGWKLSNGNAIKDWKACFNAQWQTLKFKEDIDYLNSVAGTTFFKAPIENKPTNEVERLDLFLANYSERGTEIPFEKFGEWYDFMRLMNILKILSDEEKQMLKNVYGNNGAKLKAAWVQQTLNGFVNTGLKISDVFKIRQNLHATEQGIK